MKRPAFQFYHGDWRSNAKLRRCSHAERGAWIDTMCLFADSDDFGMLRWPLKDLAQAVGCPLGNLKALHTKEVLKGSDSRVGAYIYTPRHGGKDGAPVVLISEQDGPLWYSSRMVRDEYLRSIRGDSTRFKSEPDRPPSGPPKPPKGGQSSTGSTASTSSSTSKKEKDKTGAFALPDWVPAAPWAAWLEVRRRIKAPNTDYALNCAVKDLERIRDDGDDPQAVLDKAVARGWRGLFPLNGNGQAAPDYSRILDD